MMPKLSNNGAEYIQVQINPDRIPCRRSRYPLDNPIQRECPACASPMFMHQYDQQHTPHLVHGYYWHCHTCDKQFQDVAQLSK